MLARQKERRAGSRHRRELDEEGTAKGPSPKQAQVEHWIVEETLPPGFTLKEIEEQLSRLPNEQVPTGDDWSRLGREWDARVDERISELKRLKRGLSECISCGCLSLDTCKLSNPADKAAALGPGPRYWVGRRTMEEVRAGIRPGRGPK